MSQNETVPTNQEAIPEGVDRIPPFIHSLYALMRLLGKPVSMPLLLGGVMGGPDTGSPAACLRSAKKWGLSARLVHRENLNDISPLTLPCILLLKGDRSCVLVRRKPGQDSADDEAEIVLPETGEAVKTASLTSLAEDYTGYAVFCTLEGKLDGRTEGLPLSRHKRWFWDVILHYLPLYKHVIVASVIINIAAVAGSLFAMNVYDRVVPNQAMETLWVLTLGILIAYLLDFILRNVRSYFVDLAGRNADVILSTTLIRKVLTLRLDAKPDSTGALVNNLREFESLREFFSSGSLLAFVDLPFLLFFLLLIAMIGGPVVFVLLIAIPLLIGSGLFLQLLARRNAEHHYRQNMQKNALLVEMISGLETVKTSMAENRLQNLWEQIADVSAESSRASRRYSSLAVSVANSVSQLVAVAVIVWGVYRITEGSMTMGGLIACNILSGRAMSPIMQISGMLSRLQQSRMALGALNKVMELPSENDPGKERVDFDVLHPSFSFEKATFSYPGSERSALTDVSFTIRPYEKVGIVGRMGSGKSTIGKLMAGLYDPKDGSVRYGGVDIRQLDTVNLRQRIGFMPQDVFLFYGSIRDNIALGDPSVDDRMILRAAYAAGATDFIQAHPSGFGAQVGERGMLLSGGQRQSLALARALLHDPEVLILDEPTSNMDRSTESAVKTRIAKLAERKTLVIITHRPSLVDLVDRLILVEGGRIIADGPKEEVLLAINARSAQPAASAANGGRS